MSLIPALPPTGIVLANRKPRENKVYTLHNSKNNPFIIRQNAKDEPYFGSTMISFKREIDAIQFAYMIETHYKETNEWPSTTFEGISSLFLKANIKDETYIPNELYLKTWDIPALRLYCAGNILNLFIMHSLTLKDNNIYHMKGEQVTLTIPFEDCAVILEKMYMREFNKDLNDEWN
jgi:hypothetical protein